MSDEVRVTGAVKTPLTLTVEYLKAFPPEQLASVTVTRRVAEQDTTSTVRGVRLTAVLDRVGFAGVDHNDWKQAIMVASATDGYRVVLSYASSRTRHHAKPGRFVHPMRGWLRSLRYIHGNT